MLTVILTRSLTQSPQICGPAASCYSPGTEQCKPQSSLLALTNAKLSSNVKLVVQIKVIRVDWV